MVVTAREQLAIDAVVNDQATRELRRIEQGVGQFGAKSGAAIKRAETGSRRLLGTWRKLGKAAGALGAVAGVAVGATFFGRQAIAGASEFGVKLGEVLTLLDEAPGQADRLSDSLFRLAEAQGTNEAVLAGGLYQAISAGIGDAAEATVFLGEANKLAVAGVTSTTAAVDLLTTGLNAYRLGAEQAGAISDAVFQTVRRGKTTVEELSGSLGQILPIAAALGVPLEDVLAAVATLTLQGVRTGEAVTQVRSALLALLKRGKDISRAFEKVGGSFQSSDVAANGLQETLQALRDAVNGNQDELVALLGRVEAVNGAFGITGENAATYRDILDDVRDSAGATGEAFDKQLSVPANRLRLFFNRARVALVRFGARALELVVDTIERARRRFPQLLELVERIAKGLGGTLVVAARAFAAALGAALDVAEVLAGVLNRVTNLAAGALGVFSGLFALDSQTFARGLRTIAEELGIARKEAQGLSEDLAEITVAPTFGFAEGTELSDGIRDALQRGDFARALERAIELEGALVEANIDPRVLGFPEDGGSFQFVNRILDRMGGTLTEVGDRLVVVTQLQDSLVAGYREAEGRLGGEVLPLHEDWVAVYRELGDAGLTVQEREEKVAELLRRRAQAAADARREALAEGGVAQAAIERARRELALIRSLGQDLQFLGRDSDRSAAALTARRLEGLDRERRALEERVELVRRAAREQRDAAVAAQALANVQVESGEATVEVAHAAARAAGLSEEAYRRVVAAALAAREAGLQAIAEREAQELEDLLAAARKLETERLGGLEAELAGIDATIDAQRRKVQEAARGNELVRQHQERLLESLEREREIRTELALDSARTDLLRQEAALLGSQSDSYAALARAAALTGEIQRRELEATLRALGAQNAEVERLLGLERRRQDLAARDLALRSALADPVYAAEERRLAAAYEQAADELERGEVAAEGFLARVRELSVAGREGAEAFGEGFGLALGQFAEDSRNDHLLGANAARDLAGGLRSDLAGAIVDVGQNWDNLGDAVRNFGAQALQTLARVAAEIAATKAVGGLADLFGADLGADLGQSAGLTTASAGLTAAGAEITASAGALTGAAGATSVAGVEVAGAAGAQSAAAAAGQASAAQTSSAAAGLGASAAQLLAGASSLTASGGTVAAGGAELLGGAAALGTAAGATIAAGNSILAGATELAAAASILLAANVVGSTSSSVAGLAGGGVVENGLGDLQRLPHYAEGTVVRAGDTHAAVVGDGTTDEAVVPMPNGAVPVEFLNPPENRVEPAPARREVVQPQTPPIDFDELAAARAQPASIVQTIQVGGITLAIQVDGQVNAEDLARALSSPSVTRQLQDNMGDALRRGSSASLVAGVKRVARTRG